MPSGVKREGGRVPECRARSGQACYAVVYSSPDLAHELAENALPVKLQGFKMYRTIDPDALKNTRPEGQNLHYPAKSIPTRRRNCTVISSNCGVVHSMISSFKRS